MTQPVNYSARRETVDGIEIVRLSDYARRTEVSIAPAMGNMAYEMLAGGRNILWFPYQSPARVEAGAARFAVRRSWRHGPTASTGRPTGPTASATR